MNIGTLAVLVILLVVVGFSVRTMIMDKKKGKSCTGCSGCGDSCHGSCGADKMVDDIMKTAKKKD